MYYKPVADHCGAFDPNGNIGIAVTGWTCSFRRITAGWSSAGGGDRNPPQRTNQFTLVQNRFDFRL